VAYDVGQITRELQARFRLFAPGTTTPIAMRDEAIQLELDDADGTSQNLATPENLTVLIDALDTFTKEVMVARSGLQIQKDAGSIVAVLTGGDAESLAAWDSRLSQWRGRLGAYDDAVSKAPPGDRQDVLWSVTAPLLLGFFGGEASKLPQQPLDAVSPFILANQLRVLDDWRDERWAMFVDDLETGFADAIKIGGGLVAVLLPAAVIAAGVWAFRRRR
jgi:hypothetical protein